LASHGADLNIVASSFCGSFLDYLQKDGEGQTPLAVALTKNQQNSFVTLIECGADFKIELKNGSFPFLEAAVRGFTKGLLSFFITTFDLMPNSFSFQISNLILKRSESYL
jgi:hypothetical protein